MNIVYLSSSLRRGSHEKRICASALDNIRKENSVAVVLRKGAPALPYFRHDLAVGYLPMRSTWGFFSPLAFSRILDRMAKPIEIRAYDLRSAVIALKARRLCRQPNGIAIVFDAHNPEQILKARKQVRAMILGGTDCIEVENERAKADLLTIANANVIVRQPENNDRVQSVRPNSEKNTVRFLYLGQLSTLRGLDVLIDAFLELEREHPGRASLTVCGEGDSREVMPLVRKVRGASLGDRVRWTGWIENPEEEILKADVAVAPHRSTDGGSTMIAECLDRGLKVISTTGRARDGLFSSPEQGIFIRPDSVSELKEAMKSFIPLSDE